jgi:hypothetical protein
MVFIALVLLGCSSGEPSVSDDSHGGTTPSKTDDSPATSGEDPKLSNVEAVTVTGDEGAYAFAATLASPDVDCTAYSNWWEVLTPEGILVFRRILDHSHADEQPFTRDGGPVKVKATDTLIVRGHFFPLGYGGQAMRGTVAKGFVAAPDIDEHFASGVEDDPPQPKKCKF